jgi:hypothetical protein
MNRCVAITKKGLRCKNKTTTTLCYVHDKVKAGDKAIDKPSVKPSVKESEASESLKVYGSIRYRTIQNTDCCKRLG